MLKTKIKISLILTFVFISATIEASAQKKYKTYSNARYNYSVSYPADLLQPQPEADNGDGRIFANREQTAEMRVYGSSNALDQTLRELYDEALDELGENATYKILKPTFFVVSGTRGDRIYYRKTIKRGAEFLTLTIEYDAADRRAFDRATARIARSFTG